MTKKGAEAGGKYGRLARFGNKRNGSSDGSRADLKSSHAWCYLCNVAHSKAEHDAIKEAAAKAIKEAKAKAKAKAVQR